MKKFFVFYLFLVFFLFPIQVLADGMVVPPYNYQVYETGQKAVIWFKDGRETLILSTTFEGNAADFGWIIPVPTKPEVEKGSDEIFTSLKELTESEHWIQPMPAGRGFGALEAPMDGKVTVVETKKVDIYDVSVLTSTESEALARWFAENDYPYPVSQAYILDEYIENNWYFIAAKINTEKLGSVVQGQLKEGHATPLMIKFETKRIVYPLKISSVTGELYESDIVYQEGFNHSVGGWLIKKKATYQLDKDNAFEGGASLKIVNQQVKEEPADKTTGPEIYKVFSQLERDREYTFSVYVRAEEAKSGYVYLAVEEPKLAGDPVYFLEGEKEWKRLTLTFKPETSSSMRLKIIGAGFEEDEFFNLDAVQVELGKTATPFESSDRAAKILPVPPYLPFRPSKEKIEILLYVFDAKKKVKLPGFGIDYAGWVRPKKIEDLAVDDQGDPLLPAGRKMYLTKLTRSMSQSEMTSDLYPRYADKNTAIGGGSSIAVDPLMVVLVFAIPFLLEVGFVFWLFSKKEKK